MLIINVVDWDDLRLYLRAQKISFFTTAVEEIMRAYREGDGMASVARVELEDGTSVRLDFDEEQWEGAFDRAIQYHEEAELYEECQRIIKLRDEVYGSELDSI